MNYEILSITIIVPRKIVNSNSPSQTISTPLYSQYFGSQFDIPIDRCGKVGNLTVPDCGEAGYGLAQGSLAVDMGTYPTDESNRPLRSSLYRTGNKVFGFEDLLPIAVVSSF